MGAPLNRYLRRGEDWDHGHRDAGGPERRCTLLGDENRDLQDEHFEAANTWADALLCAAGAPLGLPSGEQTARYWSL